jgi:hypothetical protein
MTDALSEPRMFPLARATEGVSGLCQLTRGQLMPADPRPASVC